MQYITCRSCNKETEVSDFFGNKKEKCIWCDNLLTTKNISLKKEDYNNLLHNKHENFGSDLGVNKEHEINDDISTETYINDGTIEFSWWKYDDEYITGWQYLGRSLVGGLLSFILVGFYLQAVTAYKRAKSLGNSSSACNFFSVWGALSLFIGLIPGVNLINIIPHWYLWFSNGPGYMTNTEQQ